MYQVDDENSHNAALLPIIFFYCLYPIFVSTHYHHLYFFKSLIMFMLKIAQKRKYNEWMTGLCNVRIGFVTCDGKWRIFNFIFEVRLDYECCIVSKIDFSGLIGSKLILSLLNRFKANIFSVNRFKASLSWFNRFENSLIWLLLLKANFSD